MKRIKKLRESATEVSLARLHATMQLIGVLSPRSKSSPTIAQRAPCKALTFSASARLCCSTAGGLVSASISCEVPTIPRSTATFLAGDLSSDIARNLGVEQLLGVLGFVIGGIERLGASKNGLSEVG
jgi:hypothetical protein